MDAVNLEVAVGEGGMMGDEIIDCLQMLSFDRLGRQVAVVELLHLAG